jgi:hypothetical protein
VSTSFIAGSSATLRATGVVRYFGAAFLIVWLAGWAIGEFVAIAFLILLIRSVVGSTAGLTWPIPGGDWIAGGAAGYVFLFLLVWLPLWTFGGFAALREVLRSLAGEDRISLQAMGDVELVRRAGPFSRVKTFDRSSIRRVRIRRHDKAAVIDTASGTELITSFGAPEERRAMAEWLRRELALPEDGIRIETGEAPPGWNMSVESDAARLNRMDPRTRRIGAFIVWAIAGFTALIFFGSMTTDVAWGSAVALALTLVLVSWAAWVTWSGREWLVRHGQLTSYRRFAAWEWERSFSSARLEVVESTDSDNDHHYAVKVVDREGTRTIASEMNEEADIIDLARWLAARTGFPLDLPRGLRPQQERRGT